MKSASARDRLDCSLQGEVRETVFVNHSFWACPAPSHPLPRDRIKLPQAKVHRTVNGRWCAAAEPLGAFPRPKLGVASPQ